jgi:hypothetical protein
MSQLAAPDLAPREPERATGRAIGSTTGRVSGVTPTSLLARLRRARGAVVAAEVELFTAAAEWADAHPDLDEPHRATAPSTTQGVCPACGADCPATTSAARCELGDFARTCPRRAAEQDPDGLADPFIPAVAWHAAAPLAAAVGRSTRSGKLLMRDSLLVRHRLPRLWARVLAGQVEPWRARRIAALVVHQPRDVSDWIDAHVAPVAQRVGLAGLDRMLDEAMLRLHPEEREADQLAQLDRRHATFDRDGVNHTGIVEMILRGDWADIDDFDRALAQVAAALKARDAAEGRSEEPLDVRRSRAVGVLADPQAALALMADPTGSGTPEALDPTPPTGQGPQNSQRTRRVVEIVVHLTPLQLAGLDPVMRVVLPGRSGVMGQPVPMLTETVRAWCGRDDVTLRVLPVLDLEGHRRIDAYEAPGRTLRRVVETAGTCVFPWCEHPATASDCDHVVSYDHDDPASGGATCECNLAPLCRHHHRLKTFAGWAYTPLEPGVWLWSDPYGQRFVRDRLGSRDVTSPRAAPPSRPPPSDGCRRT